LPAAHPSRLGGYIEGIASTSTFNQHVFAVEELINTNGRFVCNMKEESGQTKRADATERSQKGAERLECVKE
jgi:hypothetical protein